MAKIYFGIPVVVSYLNWRGVVSERNITPMHIYFGSTPYHPEPQFLLEAFDNDKKAPRIFALKDMYLKDKI